MFRPLLRVLRRARILVFLSLIAALVILASYMFAGFIDEAAKSAKFIELGFDHIFVPSARPHIDRRQLMSRILRYQGIPFGFFPATTAYDIDHPEAYSFWLGEEHWTPPKSFLLSATALASFRTHMNVINDIVRLEHASTLVLGDQIDIAADIKQQMRTVVESLPATWDILYLGHCSNETLRPTTFHSQIYVAADPKCVFAYALSRAGARRLKRVLDNMWPVPQKTFEDVLSDMVVPLFLEAYVVDPPLVAHVDKISDSLYSPTYYTLGNSTLDKLGLLSRKHMR
ncbi:hypothetical protein IWW46_000454 [Coemansia sp. RSA 2440]|nr:hypothetical protein IWW46_000454 [Coemansia sp. RSA 2440]